MPARNPSKSPLRSDRVRLRDGRVLVLRPVAPADAAPIDGGFALLHDEEIRRRFLHPVKALGEDYLRALTQPGPREIVLVAAETLPPGDALVGAVARLYCDAAEPRRAEFALLVSHYLAGQGLGRRLLRRLLEAARALGVREVFGDVLDDNAPMLRLAGRLGFKREAVRLNPGQVRVVKRLRPRVGGPKGPKP
jgi:RimJ/RimL family protein N-acetyltransferase